MHRHPPHESPADRRRHYSFWEFDKNWAVLRSTHFVDPKDKKENENEKDEESAEHKTESVKNDVDSEN